MVLATVLILAVIGLSLSTYSFAQDEEISPEHR